MGETVIRESLSVNRYPLSGGMGRSVGTYWSLWAMRLSLASESAHFG